MEGAGGRGGEESIKLDHRHLNTQTHCVFLLLGIFSYDTETESYSYFYWGKSLLDPATTRASSSSYPYCSQALLLSLLLLGPTPTPNVITTTQWARGAV